MGGCIVSRDATAGRGNCVTMPICDAERAALERRRATSSKALATFLARQIPQGTATADLLPKLAADIPAIFPRIAVACSGGGWRSLLGQSAALDALSELGLLNACDTVAGLSGGSWAVLLLALGGADRNLVHGSVKASENPWSAEGTPFDPSVHQYRGLASILSPAVAHAAAKVDRPLASALGKFAELVTNEDLTFFNTLILGSGGNSKIARYCSFLQDQLLSWEKDPTKRSALSLADDHVQDAVRRGALPLPFVASTHTAHTVTSSEIAPLQQHLTSNVWGDFTPFGARLPCVEGGKTIPLDRVRVVLDHTPQSLTAGRLAGVSGSMFALRTSGTAQTAPSTLVTLSNLLHLTAEPTQLLYQKQPGVGPVLFGFMRDAGLDINSPIPTVIPKPSGRTPDILVVFDSGQDSQGAECLAEAANLRYVEVHPPRTNPKDMLNFPEGVRVRVFYPPPTLRSTQPVIVYVLLLNIQSSSRVSYPYEEIISSAALVRQTLTADLKPVMFDVVRKIVAERLSSTAPPVPLPPYAGSLAAAIAQAPALTVEVPQSLTQLIEAARGRQQQSKDRLVLAANEAIAKLLSDSSPTADLLQRPLDAAKAIEAALLAAIDPQLQSACLVRVAMAAAIADHSGTDAFPDEATAVDAALVQCGWFEKRDSGHLAFSNALLWDFALACNALLEVLMQANNRSNAANDVANTYRAMTGRPIAAVRNVCTDFKSTLHNTFSRLQLDNKEWRFVYSFLAMMCGSDVDKTLRPALIKHVTNSLSKAFSDPQGSWAAALLQNDANLLRFDTRNEWRDKTGINIAVEVLCFLSDGGDSAVTASPLLVALKTCLEKALSDPQYGGRVAFIVLEAIVTAAKGAAENQTVHELWHVACSSFVGKGWTFEEQQLLGTALFAAAYRNSSLVLLLAAYKGDLAIPGNASDAIHHVTLIDAVRVGNHNAVEIILREATSGTPPIAAVQAAIDLRFFKVLTALVNDGEATTSFLKDAADAIRNRCGVPTLPGFPATAAWAVLTRRLAAAGVPLPA